MLTTEFTLPARFSIWINLRANFRAAHRADRHDQAELQIDISEGAMTFRGHDRFADDVGEVGADREIPIQTRLRAAPGPAMKLPPTPKNPPRTPMRNPIDHQIDRADV